VTICPENGEDYAERDFCVESRRLIAQKAVTSLWMKCMALKTGMIYECGFD